jgi:glycosyltransferase involved in cell wall biosynthesis
MLRSSEAQRQPATEPGFNSVDRLRVAVVSDAAPERNGVGAYYRDLVEHLRTAGARVDLIAPRWRSGVWHGGLAFPLPGDSTQKILVPSFSRVTRRLERMAPHTIVVPTPGPYGMLGLRLARRLGAALVVGFHTHYERLADLYGNKILGRMGQAYLYLCNRLLFKHGEIVLANSREMVDVARELGAAKVALMGTPIPRKFLREPVKAIDREPRRILFAGRLAPEKNVEAVAAAARDLPGTEFLIAGDGPLRRFVQDEAAKLPNLSYLGWVARGAMLSLLDSTDILVLPSRIESFGTIALEAMARGRVVVVSSQCGILDWQAPNRALFQMRPDESLAATIQRISRLDPAIREKKARLAREAAMELNEWNLNHWLDILSANVTIDG